MKTLNYFINITISIATIDIQSYTELDTVLMGNYQYTELFDTRPYKYIDLHSVVVRKDDSTCGERGNEIKHTACCNTHTHTHTRCSLSKQTQLCLVPEAWLYTHSTHCRYACVYA